MSNLLFKEMKKTSFPDFSVTVSGVLLLIISLLLSCSEVKKEKQQNFKPGQLNYDLLKHESIGRGVIAFFLETGKKVYWGEGSFDAEKEKVYVGWRLLAKDPAGVAFNIYRQVDDGQEMKLNESPVTGSTNFIDGDLPKGEKFSYTVKTVLDGKETEASKPYVFSHQSQPNP
jgi:hypothetical protein